MKATSTREAVSRAARDALGVDDIDATASLSDLGMDSLAGAEFVADLSRRLGRAVAPALLIECDTIDSIVSALGEDDVVEEEVEEVAVCRMLGRVNGRTGYVASQGLVFDDAGRLQRGGPQR